MFCPNCGNPNPDNANNCGMCGHKFNDQPAQAQPQYSQPQYDQPQYGQPQYGQPQYGQPQYGQPQYGQPQYSQPQQTASAPGKGLCVTSMILGIISLVLFCFWYISIPCAIVGVILGFVGKSKAKAAGAPSGTATAGIACSFVAIGLWVIMFVLAAIGLAALSSEFYI